MSWGKIWFVIGILSSAPVAADNLCAKNFSEIEKSPRFDSLKPLLSQTQRFGFVNKTEGSYFFIEQKQNQFYITFYTTGFLDLFGVRRSGPITFCEKNGQLTAEGLDRVQNIFIEGERMEFGQRSARESFIRGPMPEKLARINEVPKTELAGD